MDGENKHHKHDDDDDDDGDDEDDNDDDDDDDQDDDHHHHADDGDGRDDGDDTTDSKNSTNSQHDRRNDNTGTRIQMPCRARWWHHPRASAVSSRSFATSEAPKSPSRRCQDFGTYTTMTFS